MTTLLHAMTQTALAVRNLVPQQLRNVDRSRTHSAWPQPITWANGRLTAQVQITPRKPSKSAATVAAELLQQAKAAPNAEATYNSHLTTARLKVWDTAHGADATQLLAMLMVVIGTPCECGARQYGHGPAWVRQLHGALRAISAMCTNGYRWDSATTPMLDRAIQLAAEQRPDLDHNTFVAAWIEANGLANAIEQHQFMATEIA